MKMTCNTCNTRRGFTLIELLVVVLIIGILAAIALPQYQKAVLKSRFNALKPTADAIRTSQEAYFMENGVYAEDMADLPIKIENSQEDTQITFSDIDEHEFVRASNPNTKNRYTVYLNHSVNFAGNTYCEAPSHEGGETLEDRVCINEGGHDPVSSPDGYSMYLLTGASGGNFISASGPIEGPCTEDNNRTCDIYTLDNGQHIECYEYTTGNNETLLIINKFDNSGTFIDDGAYYIDTGGCAQISCFGNTGPANLCTDFPMLDICM